MIEINIRQVNMGNGSSLTPCWSIIEKNVKHLTADQRRRVMGLLAIAVDIMEE